MKYTDSTNVICLDRPTGGASDKRLKKDIKNLQGVLSKVLALRPVTWRWKEGDDSRIQYGFVAQEVEKLFPEIVKEGDWQGKKAKVMSSHDLLPYTIEALKEQHEKIEKTEEQLKELLATFKKQEAEIKTLKHQLDKKPKQN